MTAIVPSGHNEPAAPLCDALTDQVRHIYEVETGFTEIDLSDPETREGVGMILRGTDV